ncbi:meiosis initiator protein [Talpa occidentalis]|uniref:meiosis initiator protein n=1 Tax=Talpa occidentalis TaxID=50954 RepID=UPI0018905AFE|nr:meiosis initiator protein [Talpa occidentalis]
MWGSSRLLYSPEWPRASPLSPNDRKQRKNHTSKLQELALLLPMALKIGTKKLTKKEILLHVLHYIHFLQRNIDVAKALLKIYTTDGDSTLRGGGLAWNPAAGPARQRHSTPLSTPHSRKSPLQGACRKPQKKWWPWESERHSRAQNPRRYLALVKPKKQESPYPEQQGGTALGATTPPSCAYSYSLPQAASPLPPGDRKGVRSWLTLLDVAENSVHCGTPGCCCGKRAQPGGPYSALEDQQGAQRLQFLNRTQPFPRQKLVFDSSEEADKEDPNADPWLPAWTREDSPHGSPLALEPPQIDDYSVTGHLSEILGLSPSLFSSLGKMLPEQILEDDTEYLTQALFEEVLLEPVASPLASMLEEPRKDTPSEAPEDAPGPHGLCPSSVSLDHCYLPLSGNGRAPASPSSADTDPESDTQADPKGLLSSSDDGDYTWTPSRRAPALATVGRKARKGRGPVKPKESKAAAGPTQMKKKCVNGFIMFCRMNRKQYIRACPGTASTAATKELAQLWRVMTQQERRPYCIKARRFSRQHNRIVKQESSGSEDEDWEPPKPFYQLLAEKARSAPKPAPPPPAPRV